MKNLSKGRGMRLIAVLENTLQANSIQFLAMEDGLDELYSIRGFTTDVLRMKRIKTFRVVSPIAAQEVGFLELCL